MSIINTLTGWMKAKRRDNASDLARTFADRGSGTGSNASPARGDGLPYGFPRFRVTASDQLGSASESVFARTRMKLLGAFTPSQPVSERRRFAGRLEVLNAVIRAIEERRLHVVVYGERGLGKTSLMHVLTQAAREARYLVVYVSCGEESSFDEIFRTIASHIPMLFHSTVGPTSADVEKGKTLADSLSNSPITPRVASDILAKIVGTRVVVILDEFDRSHSDQFRRSIAELIKNLSDRLVRVQLVIAGVAANLTELLEHVPSIQRNIFALQVPWMPPTEIRVLIKNGSELSGLTFDEAAESAIISAAHGSPYLATLLSHHAGLCALDENRIRVALPDVLVATANAALEFRGRLSPRAVGQLKSYGSGEKMISLGPVSGTALLSNGYFREEDLWAYSVDPDSGKRQEGVIKALTDIGILKEHISDDGRAFSFSEEGVAGYLWLLSAEATMKADVSSVLSKQKAIVSVAKKTPIDR